MKYIQEIQNLKCGGCANTIRTKLSKVDGVEQVDIDIEQSLVSVVGTEGLAVDTILQALRNMGYPAVGEDNTLANKAKSFVSCATGRLK